MTTFTVTAEPSHIPPRVRLDFDTEVVGSVFTEIAVQRDGTTIRSQPPVGSQVSVAYDYDAVFGVAQTWAAAGTIADAGAADWSENWASLASWTGDTADWSVAAGSAVSTAAGAKLNRSATGTIQQVDVTDPVQVLVELLTSGDVLVASVLIDSRATLTTASGATQAIGTGDYSLVLSGGTATVTGSSWSASRSYTGTPTKVRIGALNPSAVQSDTWSTSAGPTGVVVDSSGNVYVCEGPSVHKYDATGTPITSWSTTGYAWGIAIDSSDDLYVSDSDNNRVRKYSSAGVAGINFAATSPRGLAVDSAGNIYVLDGTNKLVRKFTSAGAAGITWSTTGSPYSIGIDASDNIYVGETTNKRIRKFNTAGVAGITWSSVGQPTGLTSDAVGDIYVADSTFKVVRKFTSAGAVLTSWSAGSNIWGVAVASTLDVYITDLAGLAVRMYDQQTTSIGQVIETPISATSAFSGSDTDTLTVVEAWLIHPSLPDLSVSLGDTSRMDAIYVVADSAEQVNRGRKAEVFSPIGSELDVVVTNGNRRKGDWSLVLFAPSSEDRDAIIAIVRDQAPLLLRIPPTFGWDIDDDWYSVADAIQSRTQDRVNNSQWLFTLPLTPVKPPILVQGSEWTCGDVLIAYDTCADVLAAFDTCLDLLVGPS